MHLVTCDQMRELDSETINGGHVPAAVLMERAGRGIFDLISNRWGGELAGRRVLLVCGKGNNGGDGFVIARHLIAAGAEVTVFMLSDSMTVAPAARDALQKLIPLHPKLIKFTEAVLEKELPEAIDSSDLVVDALFGTGLSAPLREPALGIVRLINARARRVLSVDVPSGFSGDREREPREAVRASLTATIGLPKLGLYHYPGRAAVGELEVVDIGFPAEVIAGLGISRRLVDLPAARALIPDRDPADHKYRRGSVLIVAGSRQYGGAALLTAAGALRSGCGMVYVALPESLLPLLNGAHPSAIGIGLPEGDEGALGEAALPLLAEWGRKVDAVALGPGLGRGDVTLALLRDWLAGLERPAVLDADALFAYREGLAELAGHPATRILTPHSGEFGALLGISAEQVRRESGKLLRESTGENLILLHKGPPTEVAGRDGLIHTIPGGHPDMARGGTGDLLTGLVGGLLAQAPAKPMESTLLAAWIHATAGERAAAAEGRGCNSTDIAAELGAIWRLLAGEDPDPARWP